MSTKAAQVTTCLYLLMKIICWLHVLLVFIFIIYLFIYLFKAMSTKAAQVTTCFYLLMEIICWLHVLFVLIFIIYLFIYSKRCQQKQRKSPPVFIYLCKLIVDYMCFLSKYLLSICLFIQSDVNKSRWKRPPVFIYLWKSLVVNHGFRFNIHYLLFIYSKRCQQKQVEATTCFYLLMEITCCETWFSFEYSISIYLFIQSDINKSRWNWPPLFTYANHLLWDMVFVWIFSNYLFIYSKRCQQKQVEVTTCLYVFFSESEKFRLSYSMLGLTFKNIFLHNCDGNVSKRKTKRKLKSSWNREVHCERKKSTEDKLHKMWNSNYFCKKTAKRAHPCTKSAVHIFLYKKMNIYY